MDAQTLTVTVDGPRATITLDRPEKLNPLGPDTLQELIDAAAWLDARPEVTVVVLTGAGRAFSAGADLAAFGAGEAAGGAMGTRAGADLGRRAADALEGLRAITVARIHGHCVGGGVVLASACDLRVAAESTRFSVPEVALGIPLTWGGIPRLVREIGPSATKDLVLTCRPFGAAEAGALGLVNRVVADDELDAEVDRLVAVLCSRSPFTLEATKRRVDAISESMVAASGAWADADAMVTARRDPASREAAARYLEGLEAR